MSERKDKENRKRKRGILLIQNTNHKCGYENTNPRLPNLIMVYLEKKKRHYIVRTCAGPHWISSPTH